jgi:hypothetical protein
MTADTPLVAAPSRSSWLGPFLGGLVVGVVVGALATAVLEPYIGMRPAPVPSGPHLKGPSISPSGAAPTDHPMDERRPAGEVPPEGGAPAPTRPPEPPATPPPAPSPKG